MVEEVNNTDFEEKVLNSEIPVLVDFWATWCMPCKMMSPVVDEAAAELSDKKFCKVNVDDSPELAVAYGIDSIPTLLVFKNGQVANSSVGVISKEKIAELFT